MGIAIANRKNRCDFGALSFSPSFPGKLVKSKEESLKGGQERIQKTILKFGSEQKRPGANRPPEFVPESPLQKGVFGSHVFSKEL